MAKRWRKIRKWGNSHIIVIRTLDMKDLHWTPDGYLDISDCQFKSEVKDD